MCDCIAKIDEHLAKKNSRLVTTFTFGNGGFGAVRARLSTEKINTRNRDSMGALASFCPFCGASYDPSADLELVPSLQPSGDQ